MRDDFAGASSLSLCGLACLRILVIVAIILSSCFIVFVLGVDIVLIVLRVVVRFLSAPPFAAWLVVLVVLADNAGVLAFVFVLVVGVGIGLLVVVRPFRRPACRLGTVAPKAQTRNLANGVVAFTSLMVHTSI